MFDFTPYESLSTPDVYPALVLKARDQAVAKGQHTLSDVELMQQLYRAHPEVHEYMRCRTMGIPVPRELVTPVAKRDTTSWQAYAALDFPQAQAKLLDAAKAEAITKGLVARSDAEVMTAYFASHPEAYDVYRYKANGGTSVPAHLRDVATDVRKSADAIVLFRKVVDDPDLRDHARLRALDRAAFRQEVLGLARASVRKSDELKDVSDAFALDVLFSYREDLYRLWQEKAA